MAAATSSFHLPPPRQLARLASAVLPSEISQSPLLGILGVIIGAGVVTLTSRMITMGLPDYKGYCGFSYDDAAWIGTAFNAGLMFIGPFTVYLGGLIGPRRILLAAAGAFTATMLVLPFIHSYSLAIVALVFAGMTSGTFYPLTLTFALRNIPLRYLPFTIALYASSVDGALNVAPSLYGWYQTHLSWEWMFWNSALITPVMMLCIYCGIPKLKPHPDGLDGDRPSFAGFLSASLGLALILAACEQGERLDWWHSGLFAGLFISGSFFVLFAVLHRLARPNPLVDLPYLRQWNALLLGIGLFIFRFCLVTTIILVPQSLSIQGFLPDQIGPAMIWSAAPLLLLTFIAALMLLSDLDSRLLFAGGFLAMGFACYVNSQFTSVWAAENYYRTELLLGVGQSFAFIGLVSTIILMALFAGALAKGEWTMMFSCFFHTIRLFGGNIGAVIMGRYVAEREKVHSNLLGLHVQGGNWVTDSQLHGTAAKLFSHSSGLPAATARSAALISSRLRLQAYTLSLQDGWFLVAWACVFGLLLVFLLRESPMSYAELSTIQPVATLRGETRL
jgi:MFS transporter, DHA2 family, multidrug resistance protein